MKPNLPNKETCCGCASCVDACPKSALSLVEDKNGFMNISVNEDACVGCHLCETQCHIFHPERLTRNDARLVRPMAGWSTREEIIAKSASGGIFAQLAYEFLDPALSEVRYVYGAALQEDSSTRHIEIQTREQLDSLQNSKYQHSDTTGIYRQVRTRLQEGAKVLFSGVPCQIAALYSFLGKDKEHFNRLYTCEVLCHGVPTHALHRTALRVEKAKQILYYRTKEGTGWINNNNRLTYRMPDGKIITKRRHVYDFLFRSYLEFSFTRPNCFHCPYAHIDRVSDLTLADFWGWNLSPEKEKYRNYMGVSAILANSEKGRQWLSSSQELHLVPTTWEEILPKNQTYFMPTNHSLFQGAESVHKILKQPLWLQKILFQNGFSNRYMNEAFKRLSNLLLWPKHRREQKEVESHLRQTLDYLHKK